MKPRLSATLMVLALCSERPSSASEALSTSSLRARVGTTAAESMLRSGTLEVRLQGLERLGALGTPRAMVRLLAALAPGGGVATPEERLTVVRSLSAFTKDPAVRRTLASVLGGHAAPASRTGTVPHPLDQLAQGTAALALGRSQEPDALSALGRALSAGGRTAEAAIQALAAHPPRDLSPLLQTAEPSVDLAIALERLGTERARSALRDIVARGGVPARARAALALYRLGDDEVVELARRWTRSEVPLPERNAAARILALSRPRESSGAIARLLQDDTSFEEGLALALEAPNATLVPLLERRLAAARDPVQRRIIAAIGKAGGKSAVQVLERALGQPALAAHAAEALARMPGQTARKALSRALLDPAKRHLALRASTLRGLVLSEVPEGFDRAVAELSRSSSSWERSVALAAKASRDPSVLASVVLSRNPAEVSAVLPLLPLAGEDAARTVARRLARATLDAPLDLFAVALVHPAAFAEVPTTILVALSESGSAGALLGLRALAARDDPRERTRLLELLSSTDPWTRAHVALGLGRSPEQDATGILASAYRFEADPDVRQALVRGLSLRRDDPIRDRALSLSSSLDPDETVRSLSRSARKGARLDVTAVGPQAVWVAVSDAGARPKSCEVRLSTSGLAIPAAVGPDGIVLAAGLATGPVELRVAPGWGTVNDSR